MAALIQRYDRLPKEIEACRLEARKQSDRVSELERDYKVAMAKELAALLGQRDAHWRKVQAEANLAREAYEIEQTKNLKASAWKAWKERLEQLDTIEAMAHAYNRELRELGG